MCKPIHILLTGVPGCGKSTLIARVLARLNVTPGGFVTRFDRRESSDRMLLLGDGSDMRPVVCFQCGVPREILTDVFDEYGADLLMRPCPLVRMDECGRFERDAHAFQRAVRARLDGRTPVLGVVRSLPHSSWLDALLTHPLVRVICVSPDNRDLLVDELVAHYARLL